MKHRKRTVSGERLGIILHITDRRVRQLTQEGIFPRERRGRYDPALCTAAYEEYKKKQKPGSATPTGQSEDSRLTEERTRLVREQRLRLEMDNQVRRGELIPLRVFGDELEQIFLSVRQDVLRIPQIAAELEGETTAAIHEKLTRHAHRILAKIARTNGNGHALRKPAESGGAGGTATPDGIEAPTGQPAPDAAGQ